MGVVAQLREEEALRRAAERRAELEASARREAERRAEGLQQQLGHAAGEAARMQVGYRRWRGAMRARCMHA